MKSQSSRLNISNSSSAFFISARQNLYDSSSLESLSSLNSSSRSVKKLCHGDFCNYIVTNKDINYKEDIDYDELLRKVKKAYSSEGDKETTNIKLAIAVDYMIKEKEKLRSKTEIRDIPFRYMVMGRQLLERSNISLKPKNLKGIDLSELFHPLSQQTLESDKIQLRKFALRQPFKYYQSVKVCERCYQVYCLLILAQKNQFGRDISMSKKSVFGSNIRSKFETSQGDASRLSLKSSRNNRRKVDFQEGLVEGPIGPINTNNINDLLADMSHALVDMKIRSFNIREEAKDMFGSMTLNHQKVTQHKILEEKRKQKPMIHPQNIEETVKQEDLTLNFIPAANMKMMMMKTKEEKADLAWARYHAMMETQKFQNRKRAKSHRIKIRC